MYNNIYQNTASVFLQCICLTFTNNGKLAGP